MMEEKYQAILKVVNKLPKPNLHLHLDGSLSPEFMLKQAQLEKIELEQAAKDNLVSYLWNIKNTKFYQDYFSQQLQNRNWVTFGFCNQFLQKKN